MLKIFLNMVVGLSCLLMMSCSATISPHNFTGPLDSHIVDNRDGTFTDNRNLLQWTKNDLTPGPGSCYGGTEQNFRYSVWHVACLNEHNYLGYNDWRMPTYKELENLLDSPDIKNGTILDPRVHERLSNHAYWSTAGMAVFIYIRGIVILNMINPTYIYNESSNYYVWPVRSKNNMSLIASTN